MPAQKFDKENTQVCFNNILIFILFVVILCLDIGEYIIVVSYFMNGKRSKIYF